MKSKIVIVGAGNVGCATAYTLSLSGLAKEIIMIDRNVNKAEGEALDMYQASHFQENATIVRDGDYSECKDADMVIITVSAPMDKNVKDRVEMLAPTKKVMKSIVESIMENHFNGIMIVISNPVDTMAYYAYKLSGLPKNHVIGSGTNLDTGRLCFTLANLLHVNSKSIHANVIGEHGSSEVVAWSTATIGGRSVLDWMKKDPSLFNNMTPEDLRLENVNSGFKIFYDKGNTSYGIAASVTEIAKAILMDEQKILPVSVYMEGEYGLNDVYLSVPTLLGRDGVLEKIEINLNEEEMEALHKSADAIRANFPALD